MLTFIKTEKKIYSYFKKNSMSNQFQIWNLPYSDRLLKQFLSHFNQMVHFYNLQNVRKTSVTFCDILVYSESFLNK